MVKGIIHSVRNTLFQNSQSIFLIVVITAFDMDRLVGDVKKEISNGTQSILLEGIMLYEDK